MPSARKKLRASWSRCSGGNSTTITRVPSARFSGRSVAQSSPSQPHSSLLHPWSQWLSLKWSAQYLSYLGRGRQRKERSLDETGALFGFPWGTTVDFSYPSSVAQIRPQMPHEAFLEFPISAILEYIESMPHNISECSLDGRQYGAHHATWAYGPPGSLSSYVRCIKKAAYLK